MITWTDNATLYKHQGITKTYSYLCIVDWNPFDRRWNWSATARYLDEQSAAFHEFGTLDTVEEAKTAAEQAINRWHKRAF